nr:MAG TPA: hypothetical protein [Caudoviricetes sp.]
MKAPAIGRAYWNALRTAGSAYAGSLPVPSTINLNL